MKVVDTTIIAAATALGNSAISVIRMSGPQSHNIANQIFSSKGLDKANITNRYMYLGTLACNSFMDKCFLIYFKAPNSYTGEDMIEIQCHGGARLANAIIGEITKLDCRLASNGEFTRRAYLNGKLNLSQAEGIIDMINSESVAALKASYRMLSGSLGNTIAVLRADLIDTMASLEASFDYPEEMEAEATSSAHSFIDNMITRLNGLLSTAALGKFIHNGVSVALVGAPNAGKSSLLNRIIGQDKAIVTDIAGTTRDTVEARIEVSGILLNFIDTAGIRESSDVIEKIGIERSIKAIKDCDIAVIIVDVSCETFHQDVVQLLALVKDKPYIIAYNKCDKLAVVPHASSGDSLYISATNGYNVDTLLQNIITRLDINLTDTTQDSLTSSRHIDCLSKALDILLVLQSSLINLPIECLLIDLNKVFDLFGEITGETAKEDVIDRIFSKFCLGK